MFFRLFDRFPLIVRWLQLPIKNLQFSRGVLAQLVERLNGIEERLIALTFAHVLSPDFHR